ncbi:ankyrin repeat domain-containing protein [Lunatibacter salilacus]|uniref:ankyrin repeat domain-containing protein n=1 Tax=Lunatibacter salilacus TaxID=2483804 RepID=UPI00131DF2CE|nr:ankyrin repeat domain-containing protein [Lunatibacter salilacus]
MDYLKKIINDFEIHSAAGIKECFENGVDPNLEYKGRLLIYELITMYLRGPGFKDCVRIFVDYGLEFEDKVFLAVLLDDAASLDRLLAGNSERVFKKYTLDCAFTPLFEVSLLHICAEYGHLNCAKMLLQHGEDINIKAGIDPNGFGGQTPIFHTVNQHANVCIDVMKYFVHQHADLSLTVPGLIWGKGSDWETFIPAVNPISYAMMGLLPQIQRREEDIYEIVGKLMRAAYNIDYNPGNIPNRYLRK